MSQCDPGCPRVQPIFRCEVVGPVTEQAGTVDVDIADAANVNDAIAAKRAGELIAVISSATDQQIVAAAAVKRVIVARAIKGIGTITPVQSDPSPP